MLLPSSNPPQQMCTYAALVLLAAMLMSSLARVRADAGVQEADEHRVKAAFVVNFLRFVELPPDTRPIVIVVVGDDPMADALVRSAEGQILSGRAMVVRRSSGGDVPADANVVFITRAARASVPGIVRAVEGRGVLTVGDTAGFGQAGVALNLYVSEARVRFEANTAAATRAGIRISSQLLSLARIVG